MPTFTDDWGVRIHYDSWRVDDAVGVVQLVHGVGEHRGRYRDLVRALNDAGYSVWADDHRGHGETGFEQHGGDLDRMGRLGPGGHRAAVDGVRRFTDVIRDVEGERMPLILLGHSWGSFLAQILVNRHPDEYDAVVLSAPVLRTPFHVETRPLNDRHAHLGTTGAEWLSRDPAVAAAFVADPYTTLTPLQKLFGLRETLRLFGLPSRSLPAELPVLLLVGSDDALGRGDKGALALAKAYARRSGLVDLTLVVYDGARHELFNETNRDEVRADLVRWLDERFAVD